MVQSHCEFVKYCCYFNLICETLQVEPKLSKQLQVCVFNYFLIDIMQARLLEDNIMKKRTALQYIEQILDIWTCSDLVNVIFIFLTGLPQKTKEEEMLIESDDLDSSMYNSRLSMSIEGSLLQIGMKQNSSTNASNRDSDLTMGGLGMTGLVGGSRQVQYGEENGLLAHFMKRMKFINFEEKNK